MNFFFRSNTWQEFLLLLHSGAGIFFPINTSVSFRPVDSGILLRPSSFIILIYCSDEGLRQQAES